MDKICCLFTTCPSGWHHCSPTLRTWHSPSLMVSPFNTALLTLSISFHDTYKLVIQVPVQHQSILFSGLLSEWRLTSHNLKICLYYYYTQPLNLALYYLVLAYLTSFISHHPTPSPLSPSTSWSHQSTCSLLNVAYGLYSWVSTMLFFFLPDFPSLYNMFSQISI